MKPAINYLALCALAALLPGMNLAAPAQDSANRHMADVKVDPGALPNDVKLRTSFAPVAKKVGPSVVNVYSTRTVTGRDQNPMLSDPFFRRFFGGGEDEAAPRPRTQQGLGSGVIISQDGYIITNNHVVEDSTDIRVALVGGEEYPAKLIGTDPATDIAVLKVDRTGLPAIVLTDSAQLEVGDTVLAVGNPFGIGQTLTVGIVSGLAAPGWASSITKISFRPTLRSTLEIPEVR